MTKFAFLCFWPFFASLYRFLEATAVSKEKPNKDKFHKYDIRDNKQHTKLANSSNQAGPASQYRMHRMRNVSNFVLQN